MKIRFSSLFLSAFTVLFSSFIWAQPTEAEIKKQITNAGTKSIKFTKTTGTRQWNGDVGNWEYVRGVEVTRTSQFPGIDLVVIGDVVYQYTGAGKYSYWKFRTISNEYLGLPNPSAKELTDLFGKDWAKYFGFYFQKITKMHEWPALAEDPKWLWHTPNSVEFRVKHKADVIASNTTVETRQFNCRLRIYRDDPKGPWKNFLNQGDDENILLSTRNHTEAEMRDLEKQTLAFTINEQMSKQQQNVLPSVEVPEFATFHELVIFLHGVLREGTAEQLHSVLLKMLAPRFFVAGSSVQLNQQGADIINNAIKAGFQGTQKYKDQYCINFQVNKSLSSSKYAYVMGAINNATTVFGGDQANLGYVEGVPQLKWKLVELRVGVRQDADAISFINSFSDKKKLCPND